MEVGTKLWLVPSDLYRAKDRNPEEVIVKKVGRKYFEIEGHHRKFSIETLQEVNEINYKAQCYLTLKEIEDKAEHAKLSSELRAIFVGYGKLPFTIDTLREIKQLLNQLENK